MKTRPRFSDASVALCSPWTPPTGANRLELAGMTWESLAFRKGVEDTVRTPNWPVGTCEMQCSTLGGTTESTFEMLEE